MQHFNCFTMDPITFDPESYLANHDFSPFYSLPFLKQLKLDEGCDRDLVKLPRRTESKDLVPAQ